MINKIFNPKKIAVIGATDRKDSVGRGIIENLKGGSRKVFYINSRKKKVFGKKTYQKITDIEEKIDLAVVAIPQEAIDEVIEHCVEKKVGGVVIISSGFAETGKEGRKRQEKIREKLSLARIPLVGPNCLGLIRPPVGLNVSFAPGTPPKGGIAFISQSGGLIDAVIDGAENNNFGFSLIISVGNAAGMGIDDYITIADEDKNTKVIALYIEGVKDGRLFLETLRNTKKPVIILKAGKTKNSRKAVTSHTGSLAGEYKIFSAALRQGGAIEAKSLEELFDIAKVLSWQEKNKGTGVGIVTNGGGAGVLLADLLDENNIKLPQKMSNPLDVLGDASPDKYETACKKMIRQKEVSLLVVIQTPQTVTKPFENAKRIKSTFDSHRKPVVTVFMGLGEENRRAINYLEKYKVPNYSDPKRALKPIMALINKI